MVSTVLKLFLSPLRFLCPLLHPFFFRFTFVHACRTLLPANQLYVHCAILDFLLPIRSNLLHFDFLLSQKLLDAKKEKDEDMFNYFLSEENITNKQIISSEEGKLILHFHENHFKTIALLLRIILIFLYDLQTEILPCFL